MNAYIILLIIFSYLANSFQSPCQGDSGGPLIVSHEDGRKTLEGIFSGGISCGKNTPSWYTRVICHSQSYFFVLASQFVIWITLKHVLFQKKSFYLVFSLFYFYEKKMTEIWKVTSFFFCFFFGLQSQLADIVSIPCTRFYTLTIPQSPPSHLRDYSTCNNASLEFSRNFVSSFDPNEWCLKNGLHSGGLNSVPLDHESSALTTRPGYSPKSNKL